MANITKEQEISLYSQLRDAAEQLLKVQQEQKASAPTGEVLGASTTNFDGMQAARGDEFAPNFEGTLKDNDITQEDVGILGGITGVTGIQSGQKSKTVSGSQALSYIQNAGLSGLVDPKQLVGKTAYEASRMLSQEKARRMAQTNANTSFAFNPEILNKTQRAVDKFGFALDEINNDPFEPKDYKDESQKSTIEITSREIANLFNTPEELYNAYQTNPQFQNTINSFAEKGGTIDGIANKITAPVTNGQTQDSASYLASLRNENANQEAQEMALQELAPESDIAQEEILRNAGIPADLKKLYFGDEKTIGLLEMKANQAEEEIKLLEERERDEARTAREKASLTIDKYKAEVKKEKAKIEQNRLQAKNYITARLAKLGALTTSGAAPVAIQTIETRYEQQAFDLDTNYKFAVRQTEIELDEKLSLIENGTDEDILKIQSDLTLDTEKVAKEILKAQQAADKETYRITEQYARRLRERTTKYTTDLKKAAEKAAKEYAKSLAGDLSGFIEGQYVRDADGEEGVVSRGKVVPLDITPTDANYVEQAGILNRDAIQYFVTRSAPFKAWVVDKVQTGEISSNDSQLASSRITSVSELTDLYKEWQEENKSNSASSYEKLQAQLYPDEN